MINDILDLAKMEAGTSDWHMANLAPKAVIEHARRQRRPVSQDAPRRARNRIAEDLPEIRADADRLTQVIVNLMSNAVKFCAERDGRIRLDAWREAQFLRLDVTDNGSGIARQDQERIFERFQQAGNTLTDKPQGTGLGLPICREILRRFGGDIWVETSPARARRSPSACRPRGRGGRGTIARESPGRQRGAASARLRLWFNGARILRGVAPDRIALDQIAGPDVS